MNVIAHIVMAVWIPAVLVLFAVLPSRRAVIASFLAAWLFLPMATYPLPFLPDYTKMSATCAGVFIATVIFDVKRVVRFKPSWADVPMVLFCLFPFVTSNERNSRYDGVSDMLSNVITWAFPYFIGRIYFNDARGLRELAMGMFIGGLLYIPLCLFEVRMSPQLHNLVYGFFPRMVQVRDGGWRPSVFMDGGLQVGMWMTAASLVGIWQWKTGTLKKMWGVSATWLLVGLMVTTILCRATGGLGTGARTGRDVVDSANEFTLGPGLPGDDRADVHRFAIDRDLAWRARISLARMVNSDRADSLKFRLDNEDLLAAKASNSRGSVGEIGVAIECLTNGEKTCRLPTGYGSSSLADMDLPGC